MANECGLANLISIEKSRGDYAMLFGVSQKTIWNIALGTMIS